MKVKKIGSLLLALVMCFSLMSVAWAADDGETPTYTVTIQNKDGEGYVYYAYQIFTGTLDDTEEGHVYLAVTDWGSNIAASSELYSGLAQITNEDGDYVFVDDNGDPLTSAAAVAEVLTAYSDNSEVARQFAGVMSEYVTGDPAGVSGDYDQTLCDGIGGYQITDLEAGYYLIKNVTVPENADKYDGAYSDLILEVLEDETVVHKGEYPTIKKTITDNDANHTDLNTEDGNTTGVVADYSVGDAVPFHLTAQLPAYDAVNFDLSKYEEGYTLVFHDAMTDGLEFNADSVTVTVTQPTADGMDTETFVLSTGSYQVTKNVTHTDEQGNESIDSFDLTLLVTSDELTDINGNPVTIREGATIVVDFNATLTSDACVGNEGRQENDVYLEYNNDYHSDSTGYSPKERVYVFTFELDVFKYTMKEEEQYGLKDAEFQLSRTNNGETEYLVVDDTGYVASWTTNSADASTLTSDSDGNITIPGLDEGTYTLTETKAPEGYKTLDQPLTITIAASYEYDDSGEVINTNLTITVNGVTEPNPNDPDAKDNTSGVVTVKVENNHGSELPSTGGIGTTIFYIIGGVLVVGAAVVLIARRRMSRDAE